uniref:Uncharacterized protein n=1 Tax=Zea mays TaxID=4577 RepID=A0A804MVV1_MAIZE
MVEESPCGAPSTGSSSEIAPTRDQEQSLGLAWFTLHSRCFHRVFSHRSSSACELAPIFNELVDLVSFDGELLQAALSRTMQVDEFTTTLLEIHDKMTSTNKNEDIRLGLNRSEYMLDSETSSVLQIDYLIIISWPWLPCQ